MKNISELLNVKISQAEFGRILGISKQAISKQAGNGVLNPDGTFLDWMRSLYGHLSGQAAGRGGDEQSSLARERTREAKANAQLKELQFHKEVGNLIPVAEIEPALESWVVTMRSETTHAVEKIIAAIESRHGIKVDRDMVDEYLNGAFQAIADYPKAKAFADKEDDATCELQG